MTITAPAMQVSHARGRAIALAPHHSVELIERPAPVRVPGAPYYAHGLLGWRDAWLPLIDLHTLLRAHGGAPMLELNYALVVAYQAVSRGPLRYGALGLASAPLRIAVCDDHAAPLPTDSDLWPLITVACVAHGGLVLPIVEPARLFAQAHG
jgi:hypothetical protein